MRARHLFAVGLGWAACLLAAFDLLSLLDFYRHDWRVQDFTIYYAGAQIGLAQGWSHLYDLRLQEAAVRALRPGAAYGPLDRLNNPPPMAWLVTPLTLLPLISAYAIWSLAEAVCLGLAWRLASPGAGISRAFHLVAILGFYPAIYSIQLGQPAPMVMLSVVAAWYLLGTGRPVLAGLALTVMTVKPQLGILIPPALLLLRQWRAAGTWAVAMAGITILSLLPLGVGGVRQYLSLISSARTIPFNYYLTLGWYLGPYSVTAELLVLTVATIGAWRNRESTARVFSIALLAGAVAAPYLHWNDLTLLVPAAWLAIRAGAGRTEKILMLFTFIAVEFAWVVTPLPWLLAGIGWLAVASFTSPASGRRMSSGELTRVAYAPVEAGPTGRGAEAVARPTQDSPSTGEPYDHRWPVDALFNSWQECAGERGSDHPDLRFAARAPFVLRLPDEFRHLVHRSGRI